VGTNCGVASLARSCGCRGGSWKHGGAEGRKLTPEYLSWCSMRDRCRRPKCKSFARYGGRGIKVCERWNDFANFLADMGKRPSPQHSIDRIDNDGDYEPGNCRWSARLEQARNTRITKDAKRLEHDGRVQTISEWAEQLGISRSSIKLRLRNGWPIQRALREPPDEQRVLARLASRGVHVVPRWLTLTGQAFVMVRMADVGGSTL
jgi:hypothetical protein